jgi:predicted transcriptional regulator
VTDVMGISQAERHVSKRRNAFDILTDILTVSSHPSSKSKIMASANLNHKQCQKYLHALERMGLLNKLLEDGVQQKFVITEKGREYHSRMVEVFGWIADGDRSVWITRRFVHRKEGKRHSRVKSQTGFADRRQ